MRCDECKYEMRVAFSCQERGLCPSCGAKRGAELAAFLADEVIEDVGHAQWVFTVPKMLRFFLFRQRELLEDLSRLAYETVRELMAAAADDETLCPGMVTVIQTFGDRLNPHPHLHALVSRGGSVSTPSSSSPACWPRSRSRGDISFAYYAYYSNAARGKRRKLGQAAEAESSIAPEPSRRRPRSRG